MLAMFILILGSMVAQPPQAVVRTTVADGSVWADSWQGGAVTSTQRLRAPRPGERWLAVDVDGDGRTDLVAVVLDPTAPRVEVWLAGDDGFTRR